MGIGGLGRKSQQSRTTPLLYLKDGDRWIVVASNAGDDRHPAWWLNLKANPVAQIQIGRVVNQVRGREATHFDAIHDQAKPLQVLEGIHRTLKAKGIYLMQDIKASSHVYKNTGHLIGTLLYTVSCMHCMTGPGG